MDVLNDLVNLSNLDSLSLSVVLLVGIVLMLRFFRNEVWRVLRQKIETNSESLHLILSEFRVMNERINRLLDHLEKG